MGRDQAAAVAERLAGEGRSLSTPAIAIENAGRSDGRAIPSTLGGLAQALAQAAPSGPVILLIGDVAARADLPAVEADHPVQRARL
jgi:siroheme synthase